jgi:hypothetical protein
MKRFAALFVLLAGVAGLAYWLSAPAPELMGAGFTGWRPDPVAKREFIKSLGRNAYLTDANPALLAADGREVFLYRATQKVAPNNFPLNQGQIGSCVSFGFGCACDILLGQQVVLGQSDHYQPACEESIYSLARTTAAGTSNGGFSDGAVCAYAAKGLNKWGVLFRQNYPDLGIDVSTYNVSRCKTWGAYPQGTQNTDLANKILAVCKQHPIRQVAAVRTATEAAAAIKAGYPVVFGSSLLPSNTRDKDGFSRVSNGGGHCQCMVAYRQSPEGILVQNSWGKFNDGPKYPPDQPDGSYWVTMADAGRLIGGEAYALSDEVGFPVKDISKLNRQGW